MFIKAVIANLHNEKTNRYHPIIFREAPLPSNEYGEAPIRLKSSGHHTEGFETKTLAMAECERLALEMDAITDTDVAIVWDGLGVPAMVVFMDESSKIIRL